MSLPAGAGAAFLMPGESNAVRHECQARFDAPSQTANERCGTPGVTACERSGIHSPRAAKRTAMMSGGEFTSPLRRTRAGALGGAPRAPPGSLKPTSLQQVEALIGPGPRGHAPAADDEADAEGDPAGEGDAGTDAGQAEGSEDDADQVEGRLLDLDPRHGLGGQRTHRRSSPE